MATSTQQIAIATLSSTEWAAVVAFLGTQLATPAPLADSGLSDRDKAAVRRAYKKIRQGNSI